MDNKFLSYFQAGSKPESSNFDGSFQNLFTASFGGLTPVCVKPVLADDHWKINLNSEVKVNTLSAPAYTNIKQNFYSFFVSNQSVWKHWNSFITNGTDFQDVYGSNTSNQSLDNAWKIPSIPTNYLQFISKVANGFALPVFTISVSDFADYDAFKSAFPALGRIFGMSRSGSNPYYFTLKVNPFDIHTNIGGSCTLDGSIIVNLLLSTAGLSVDYSKTILSLCRICPYISFYDHHDGIDTVHLSSTPGQNNGVISFDSITFGISLDDLPILLSILQDRDINSLLPYSNPSVDFNVSDYYQFINFRFFENETSNKFDINESPFGIKSGSQSYYFGDVQLNTSRYYRKSTLNKKISQSNHYFDGVGTLNGYKVIQHDIYQLSESWAKELCLIKSLTSPYPESILLDATSLTTIPSTSPIYNNYIALFESEDFMPTLKLFNNCRYSSLSLSPSLHIVSQPLGNFQVAIPPSCNINTFDDPRSTYLLLETNSDVVIFEDFFDCDCIIPFYCNANEQLVNSSYINIFHFCSDDPNQQKQKFLLSHIPLFDSSALATGCTTFTHFIYLMQNCCKSLDYVNIPIEGFTIRGFKSYANEFISALPFMCISKIWDEYFRNRTVSSPELNFCEVNGLCYYPQQRKLYCSNVLQGDFEYFKNLDVNGWVIPFDVLPKNSQFNFTFDAYNNAYAIIKGINNFHYFNITTFGDCLSLLSGFQLNHCILHQVINSIYSSSPISDTTESVFVYGALIDNFQLPNFYNGLLHYRYQNFSKDYFSSSLLDAMSGANQEVIPQNVTELRQAEARQSFWEQTAVARSVKKFFNKMFGTTPTHMEYDRPILLGQSHTDISVGEIIQTSETDNTPQGTRTGIAGSHDVQGVCNHGFNEQGWLIILCSYTLESQYFQGLSKLLVPYKSFLDYPFRQFYHIGNQSINMREISYFSNPSHTIEFHPVVPSAFDDDSMNPYSNNSIAINPHRVTDSSPNQFPRSLNITPNFCINSSQDFNAVFGFIPRFSEYKFNQDELHGDFRNTLFSWNSFRKFHTLPYFTHNFVNWEFSGVQYDLNRLFAVQDDSDKFICSLFVNCQMHRQIPYYTVPKSL